MKTLKATIVLSILIILSSGSSLKAGTYQANGNTQGNWNISNSWSGGPGYPDDPNDNIKITGSAEITIPSGFTANLGDLTITGNGKLIINGNVTFKSITISGSPDKLINNAKVIINNNLIINTSIENNGQIRMAPGSFIENYAGITGAGDICSIDEVTTPNFTVTGPIDNNTICGTDAGGPFPIELIEFDTEQSGSNVNLYWTTASEINNDFFTVERAINDNEFQSIGTIKGAGNSNTIINYRFRDNNIPEAKTIYYRIKQTDFDGTYTYSGIKDITLENNLDIKVMPNPVKTGQAITLTNLSKNSVVKIYNAHGAAIYSREVNQNVVSISTDEIKPGLYFIRIQDQINNNLVSKKLIIR